MKYNQLINEFFNLLDELYDIKQIKVLKQSLKENKDFLNDLETYRMLKTIEAKKKLYENKEYVEYLKLETNINILLQEIKSKFQVFHVRKCYHESH